MDVLKRPSLEILDTSDSVDGTGATTAEQVAALNAANPKKTPLQVLSEDRPPTTLDKMTEYFLAGTPKHMTVRLRSKIKMGNSQFGHNWDIFQVFISLLACLLHVLSTFEENRLDDMTDEVPQTAFDKVIELALSGLFAVDLLIGFYTTDDRIWFWVKSDTVVDVLCLFPVVISLAGATIALNTAFLRALRMLRAMRILRAFRVTKNSLSAVDQKVATLSIIIISIIFMSACLVQTLEKENGMQDFGVAMYFVVVTISTVGYGDYSPASPAGRAVVCCMIIGFMVIVPVKISELADLLAMRSAWHTTYHAKPGYRNILIIGSVLEASEVEAFLEEFYHPDRMKNTKDATLQSTEIVIMSPVDPSEAMVALLFVPFWQGQVHYINGSALEDKDLKRVGARTAEACFILIGKSSSPPRTPTDRTPNQELLDYYDSQNVLYTLMVENFNHTIKTFVEIRGIDKRYPLVAADADVVLCIDRLRMTILGSTALFPGLCTFMSNLWQTSADVMSLEGGDASLQASASAAMGGAKSWKAEYARSRGMEMYARPAVDLFAGLTFSQAAFVVQRAFKGEVTLLGVEERLLAVGEGGQDGGDGDKKGAAKPTEGDYRIIRSLVCPGDAYIFPNEAAVNAERLSHGASRFAGLEMEKLQVTPLLWLGMLASGLLLACLWRATSKPMPSNKGGHGRLYF